MEMRRGLTSLASVSATAALLGLFGTLWGISNSFHSIGSSRSTGLNEIAQALSESLVTTVLGLVVAVFALCAYRYLSGCVAKFQREMENQSIDLVNKLILHVRRSGNTSPLYFGEKSKKHLSAARSLSTFGESTMDAPLLKFDRIYRHGLLELAWPRLQSDLDAEAVLQRGMWIAFVAGALNAWLYSNKPITAAIVGASFPGIFRTRYTAWFFRDDRRRVRLPFAVRHIAVHIAVGLYCLGVSLGHDRVLLGWQRSDRLARILWRSLLAC
jgi:hypothetical protein